MTRGPVTRSSGRWCVGLIAAGMLVSPRPVSATWSICIADTETREVAVGTVTCLGPFDLLAEVPVVVVERGAGASQSLLDTDGTRREVIFDGLVDGLPPDEILAQLAELPGHESRQYGMADTQGRAFTFSGTDTFAWAGGRTFTIGTRTYAIQGNILAGACVVDAIEAAIRGTDGDIPEELMAGMEAAAATGGDGRCSCSPGDPTGCGCPVEEFAKSGHIGGMIVARVGDVDDDVCDERGCADGDYFMRLNVAFQTGGAPDPVLQLRAQFDEWRADHEGRPDAHASSAVFDPPFVPPNGLSSTTMTITLRDWRGLPIDGPLLSVTVEHAPGSDGRATIGEISDNGDGTVDVVLTAGTASGVDRLRVVVDDGVRPVTLAPDPVLVHYPMGDVDGSATVDVADILAVLAAWGPCPEPPAWCAADLDGNGVVDFADVLRVIGGWTTPGACCFGDGTCTPLTQFQCVLGGGFFRGAGVACEGACPLGACCLDDGRCTELLDADCLARGGLYQGDGTVCVDGGCPYDNCENAILVGEGSFAFSTVGTTDAGPPLPAACDEGNGLLFRKDVWFRYTASCDGTATASVCEGTFDTRLAIYADGDCPGPFLACNDDACGEDGSRSSVAFPVQTGVSYLVRIGARFAVGEGTLVIECAE